MNITQFTMEEVRCFAERQQFEIRPLTFLVGENSTGKTTALACFQVLANYLKEWSKSISIQSLIQWASFGILSEIADQKATLLSWDLLLLVIVKMSNIPLNVCQKKDGLEPAIESVTIKFTDGKIVFESRRYIRQGV